MQFSVSNILDKKYNNLILQISLEEISFCVYNTLKKNIETFGNYFLNNSNTLSEIENDIVEFIKKTPLLQAGFDEVLVLHNNNLNTFVPQALFDEEALASYLQYNVKIYDTDLVSHDEIANYEMNNVYVPYVNINNLLIDLYGNFNYKHSSSTLVKKLLDFSKNNDQAQIFVNCQKTTFQLVAIKNQKLLLFNSFDFKTKEDFIYHILFTAEQLQLNPETLQLKLFGDISKESELYDIAYKYVRNVSLYFEHNDLEKNISQEDYLKNFILIHSCA